MTLRLNEPEFPLFEHSAVAAHRVFNIVRPDDLLLFAFLVYFRRDMALGQAHWKTVTMGMLDHFSIDASN